jgi:hypothetical protein
MKKIRNVTVNTHIVLTPSTIVAGSVCNGTVSALMPTPPVQ